jgi:predicted TIM-barrel fold metal-dependent hydrolase
LKSLKQVGVDVIRSLNLAPEDEQKVFSGNARKLLKI